MKLYMFRTVSLSNIRGVSLYVQQWYISYRCADSQLDALISQIYFWNETLHVSDSFSVQHQEFSLYIQQWYMSYRFADSQLDALISQIYFWNETLHVSDSFSIHHQEFFHGTHSSGICHTGLLTAVSRTV